MPLQLGEPMMSASTARSSRCCASSMRRTESAASSTELTPWAIASARCSVRPPRESKSSRIRAGIAATGGTRESSEEKFRYRPAEQSRSIAQQGGVAQADDLIGVLAAPAGVGDADVVVTEPAVVVQVLILELSTPGVFLGE